MHRVVRAFTGVLVAAAMATPSFGAPVASDAARARRSDEASLVNAIARQEASVERQAKAWSRLAGSICVGCITSANRVAPMSFERAAPAQTVAAKVEPVRSAIRTAQVPRRFVQLRRKHYAKMHRRDRLRLALRARRLHIAAVAKRRALRMAMLRRHIHPRVTTTIIPAYLPGATSRVYRIPVDRPWTPNDDGRWRETILPTATRLRRT